MNIWRCLVWTQEGAVLATEFHDMAATANERATFYRDRGYQAAVTEGRRGPDGTFIPV